MCVGATQLTTHHLSFLLVLIDLFLLNCYNHNCFVKSQKDKKTIERFLVNYPSMATSLFHWLITVTSGLFLVWYGRLASFTLLPTFPNLVSVRSIRSLTGSRSISVTFTGLVAVDFETVNVISRAFCCYEMSLWPWCTLLHCTTSISRSNQLLNKYTLLSKHRYL